MVLSLSKETIFTVIYFESNVVEDAVYLTVTFSFVVPDVTDSLGAIFIMPFESTVKPSVLRELAVSSTTVMT